MRPNQFGLIPCPEFVGDVNRKRRALEGREQREAEMHVLRQQMQEYQQQQQYVDPRARAQLLPPLRPPSQPKQAQPQAAVVEGKQLKPPQARSSHLVSTSASVSTSRKRDTVTVDSGSSDEIDPNLEVAFEREVVASSSDNGNSVAGSPELPGDDGFYFLIPHLHNTPGWMESDSDRDSKSAENEKRVTTARSRVRSDPTNPDSDQELAVDDVFDRKTEWGREMCQLVTKRLQSYHRQLVRYNRVSALIGNLESMMRAGQVVASLKVKTRFFFPSIVADIQSEADAAIKQFEQHLMSILVRGRRLEQERTKVQLEGFLDSLMTEVCARRDKEYERQKSAANGPYEAEKIRMKQEMDEVETPLLGSKVCILLFAASDRAVEWYHRETRRERRKHRGKVWKQQVQEEAQRLVSSWSDGQRLDQVVQEMVRPIKTELSAMLRQMETRFVQALPQPRQQRTASPPSPPSPPPPSQQQQQQHSKSHQPSSQPLPQLQPRQPQQSSSQVESEIEMKKPKPRPPAISTQFRPPPKFILASQWSPSDSNGADTAASASGDHSVHTVLPSSSKNLNSQGPTPTPLPSQVGGSMYMSTSTVPPARRPPLSRITPNRAMEGVGPQHQATQTSRQHQQQQPVPQTNTFARPHNNNGNNSNSNSNNNNNNNNNNNPHRNREDQM